MSDIALIWDNVNGRGDFAVAGADLLTGMDLDTQLTISLFSDRLAETSDVIPDGTTDRRGWWGDEGETYPIGSRLWLLEREKVGVDTADALGLKVKNYCAEALQWMIDDGVVAAFSFATQFVAPNQLWLKILAYRSKGNITAQNYAWTWNGAVLYPAGTIFPIAPKVMTTLSGKFMTTQSGLILTV